MGAGQTKAQRDSVQRLVHLCIEEQREDLSLARHSLGSGLKSVTSFIVDAKTHLTTLDLSYNQLDNKSFEALAAVLPACTLTSLDVSSNCAKNAGMIALFAALPSTRLRTLLACGYNLYSKNNSHFDAVGPRAAEQLAIALAATPSLTTLDFSCHPIKDEGIGYISAVLGRSSLTSLSLDECSFKVAGATALGAGLAESPLETLSVTRNKLTGGAGTALLANLHATRLKKLELYYPGCIDEELGLSLARALAQVPTLTDIGSIAFSAEISAPTRERLRALTTTNLEGRYARERERRTSTSVRAASATATAAASASAASTAPAPVILPSPPSYNQTIHNDAKAAAVAADNTTCAAAIDAIVSAWRAGKDPAAVPVPPSFSELHRMIAQSRIAEETAAQRIARLEAAVDGAMHSLADMEAHMESLAQRHAAELVAVRTDFQRQMDAMHRRYVAHDGASAGAASAESDGSHSANHSELSGDEH